MHQKSKLKVGDDTRPAIVVVAEGRADHHHRGGSQTGRCWDEVSSFCTLHRKSTYGRLSRTLLWSGREFQLAGDQVLP